MTVSSTQPNPLSSDTRVAVSGDVKTMILYDSNKKSLAVAYLLWLILGGLGGHRFYNGKIITGGLILLMNIIGVVLAPVGIGFLLLVPAWIWILIDAFLIPGWIRSHNSLLAHRLGVA
jgi:TM2 domain-containing membrane protein YozV